jgi:hypothetical protein
MTRKCALNYAYNYMPELTGLKAGFEVLTEVIMMS